MKEAFPFGLSTSWNGLKHESLTDIFREAQRLGFRRVELYAHFTPAQLEHIGQLAREHEVEITSLHNPCPVRVDATGERVTLGDWLASTEPNQRAMAVDTARRTIDAAAALGARAIVVHLGKVDVRSRQAEVFEAIREHGFDSPLHRELVERAWREREAKKGPHLAAAIQSAREIGRHAKGSGVKVGLECRDGYFEIPSLEEYQQIFEATRGLPVGYWHDAGHGQKLENAGFWRHEELLERYGRKLVGMHIHDTRMERDHQAPGQADTDFSILAPHARNGVIQTLELSPAVRTEHIPYGVEVLRQAGFGRRQRGRLKKQAARLQRSA